MEQEWKSNSTPTIAFKKFCFCTTYGPLLPVLLLQPAVVFIQCLVYATMGEYNLATTSLKRPFAFVDRYYHSAVFDVMCGSVKNIIHLADEKPDVAYSDIGGMDIQKQEVKEAVELPLTHFELYKQVSCMIYL